jgi:hypothetical protein
MTAWQGCASSRDLAGDPVGRHLEHPEKYQHPGNAHAHDAATFKLLKQVHRLTGAMAVRL